MIVTYAKPMQVPTPGSPLVVLDRDGTLIEWVPHLVESADVQVIPGAPESVAALVDAGCTAVIVTNQSVIGRGLMSPEGLEEVTQLVHREINRRGYGVVATYACPHTPEQGCKCRKPGLAMLRAASADWNVDTSRVWIVGDNPTDMLFASRAGARGIRVMTGVQGQCSVRAAFKEVSNIVEAADCILREMRTS